MGCTSLAVLRAVRIVMCEVCGEASGVRCGEGGIGCLVRVLWCFEGHCEVCVCMRE